MSDRDNATGFQPNVTLSPELNAVMRALAQMRTENPSKLASFLKANEDIVELFLQRYGYRGSWVKPDGYLRAFDAAHAKWDSYRNTPFLDTMDTAKGAARPDPWINVWQAAAADPLAATWILGALLVSDMLGSKFGFVVDPAKLAAGAIFFESAVTVMSAASGSVAGRGSASDAAWAKVPYVPGAAVGKPRIQSVPEVPFQTALGSVKSDKSANAGRSWLLGHIPANVPDNSIVSLITYDQFGNIYLEQYLAGGSMQQVFDGPIGRIPEQYLPKTPFGQSEYGKATEPLARGVLGTVTGQFLNEGKHSSANGWDILPRSGRVRINLLGPSDLKWNSAAGAVESDRKYPLPPAMRDKNKTGPVEVGKSYPLPPPVHASGYPPPPVVLAGGQAAAWAGQQAGAAQAASQAQAQQQAAAAQAASQAQAQQQAAFQFMQAAQMAPRFIPPPPPVSRPPMPLPPSPSPVFVPPAPVFQAPPPVNPYFPPLPPVIVIPQPNNSANSFSIPNPIFTSNPMGYINNGAPLVVMSPANGPSVFH